jgi:hypothetical protein
MYVTYVAKKLVRVYWINESDSFVGTGCGVDASDFSSVQSAKRVGIQGLLA